MNSTSVLKLWTPLLAVGGRGSFHQPLRTAYVVKRKWPAPLTKPHLKPSLRKKHMIYETVQENTDLREYLTVVLAKYVDNVGSPGETVSLRDRDARLLILKKHAVYPTSEAAEKFKAKSDSGQRIGEEEYSSKFVKSAMQLLSKFILNISLNKETPWTIEPWHVRAAFRKAHVNVPESAITMPKNSISGPDMSLEDKEFYITVTINKTEKVTVRCRIHHWTTNPEQRLPPYRQHWKFPATPLFPSEDQEIIKQLPVITPPIFEENEVLSKPIKRIIRKAITA